MPPQLSSISDVAESAVLFKYKRFAKISVILTVVSQIGITISNSSFDMVANYIEDPDDCLSWAIIFPLIIGPLLAGYFLDKRYFCQVLFYAFLNTVLGQALITISSGLSELNFTMILIGRIFYAIGFSIAIPSLVRFVLLWLSPEDIPMGLAALFMVEILSQNAGVFLYEVLLIKMDTLLASQILSLVLCLLSLFIAGVLWYVDRIANISNNTDYNLLVQPPPPRFRKLLSLPVIVWGIMISTAATFGTIYTYTAYQMQFFQKFLDMKQEDLPYYDMILGAFCMVAFPLSAKVIRVDKQQLKLLMSEQFLGVLALLVLSYSAEWFSYILGLAVLGIVQATMFLTFFILLISIMKWEMIGMMIGLFFAVRNSLIIGISYGEMHYLAYLEQMKAGCQTIYRSLTFVLLGITFFFGFCITLIAYCVNKKRNIIEGGREEIKETFRGGSFPRRLNRLSELST